MSLLAPYEPLLGAVCPSPFATAFAAICGRNYPTIVALQAPYAFPAVGGRATPRSGEQEPARLRARKAERCTVRR